MTPEDEDEVGPEAVDLDGEWNWADLEDSSYVYEPVCDLSNPEVCESCT